MRFKSSLYNKVICFVVLATFLSNNTISYSSTFLSPRSTGNDSVSHARTISLANHLSRSELRSMLGSEKSLIRNDDRTLKSELRNKSYKELRLEIHKDQLVEQILLNSFLRALEAASETRPIRLVITPSTEQQAIGLRNYGFDTIDSDSSTRPRAGRLYGFSEPQSITFVLRQLTKDEDFITKYRARLISEDRIPASAIHQLIQEARRASAKDARNERFKRRSKPRSELRNAPRRRNGKTRVRIFESLHRMVSERRRFVTFKELAEALDILLPNLSRYRSQDSNIKEFTDSLILKTGEISIDGILVDLSGKSVGDLMPVDSLLGKLNVPLANVKLIRQIQRKGSHIEIVPINPIYPSTGSFGRVQVDLSRVALEIITSDNHSKSELRSRSPYVAPQYSATSFDLLMRHLREIDLNFLTAWDYVRRHLEGELTELSVPQLGTAIALVLSTKHPNLTEWEWSAFTRNQKNVSGQLYAVGILARMMNDYQYTYPEVKARCRVLAEQWRAFPIDLKRDSFLHLLRSPNQTISAAAWTYASHYFKDVKPLHVLDAKEIESAVGSHDNWQRASTSFNFFKKYRNLYSIQEQYDILEKALNGPVRDLVWEFLVLQDRSLDDAVKTVVTADRLRTSLLEPKYIQCAIGAAAAFFHYRKRFSEEEQKTLLATGLEQSATKADFWQFIALHWEELSDNLKSVISPDMIRSALFDENKKIKTSAETIANHFLSPDLSAGESQESRQKLKGSLLRQISLYHPKWFDHAPDKQTLQGFAARTNRRATEQKFSNPPRSMMDITTLALDETLLPEGEPGFQEPVKSLSDLFIMSDSEQDRARRLPLVKSTRAYYEGEGEATVPAFQLLVEDLQGGAQLLIHNMNGQLAFYGEDNQRLFARHMLDLIFSGDITDFVFEVPKLNKVQRTALDQLLELIKKYQVGEIQLIEMNSVPDSDITYLNLSKITSIAPSYSLNLLVTFLKFIKENGGGKILRHVQFHFVEVDSNNQTSEVGISELAPDLFRVSKQIIEENRRAILLLSTEFGFKSGAAHQERVGKENGDSLVTALAEANPSWAKKAKVYTLVSDFLGTGVSRESFDPLIAAAAGFRPMGERSGLYTVGVRVAGHAPFADIQVVPYGPLNTFRDVDGVIIFRTDDDNRSGDRDADPSPKPTKRISPSLVDSSNQLVTSAARSELRSDILTIGLVGGIAVGLVVLARMFLRPSRQIWLSSQNLPLIFSTSFLGLFKKTYQLGLVTDDNENFIRISQLMDNKVRYKTILHAIPKRADTVLDQDALNDLMSRAHIKIHWDSFFRTAMVVVKPTFFSLLFIRESPLRNVRPFRSELRTLAAVGVILAVVVGTGYLFIWFDRMERRNRLLKESRAFGKETEKKFGEILSFLKQVRNRKEILKAIDDQLKGHQLKVAIDKMYEAFSDFAPDSGTDNYFSGTEVVIEAVTQNPAGDFKIDIQFVEDDESGDSHYEFVVMRRPSPGRVSDPSGPKSELRAVVDEELDFDERDEIDHPFVLDEWDDSKVISLIKNVSVGQVVVYRQRNVNGRVIAIDGDLGLFEFENGSRTAVPVNLLGQVSIGMQTKIEMNLLGMVTTKEVDSVEIAFISRLKGRVRVEKFTKASFANFRSFRTASDSEKAEYSRREKMASVESKIEIEVIGQARQLLNALVNRPYLHQIPEQWLIQTKLSNLQPGPVNLVKFLDLNTIARLTLALEALERKRESDVFSIYTVTVIEKLIIMGIIGEKSSSILNTTGSLWRKTLEGKIKLIRDALDDAGNLKTDIKKRVRDIVMQNHYGPKETKPEDVARAIDQSWDNVTEVLQSFLNLRFVRTMELLKPVRSELRLNQNPAFDSRRKTRLYRSGITMQTASSIPVKRTSRAVNPGLPISSSQTLSDVITQSVQIVDGDVAMTVHASIQLQPQTILVLGPSVSTPDIIRIAAGTGAHVVPLVGTGAQATLINQHFNSLGLSVDATTTPNTTFLRSELRKGATILAFGLANDREVLARLNRSIDGQAKIQIADTLDAFGKFFGIDNLSARLNSELREAWFAAVAA